MLQDVSWQVSEPRGMQENLFPVKCSGTWGKASGVFLLWGNHASKVAAGQTGVRVSDGAHLELIEIGRQSGGQATNWQGKERSQNQSINPSINSIKY